MYTGLRIIGKKGRKQCAGSLMNNKQDVTGVYYAKIKQPTYF